MSTKTASQHALTLATVVMAFAMLLFAAHAETAYADYTTASIDSSSADPACALLDSSGQLNRCTSAGEAVGECWRGETEAKALYEMAGVETLFVAPDVLEVSNFTFLYEDQSGAVRTATNYLSGYGFSVLPVLKRVVFLDSSRVVTIRARAFQECKNLKKISLPASLRRIESWAFYGCNNLRSVSLNKGLEFIGSSAFYDCISLRSIDIPASVDEVQDHAFKGCYQLRSVRSRNATPPTLGYYAFDGASPKLKIRVPKGSYLLYRTKWSAFESELVDNRDAQSMTVELVQKSIAVKVTPLGYGETIPPKKAYRVKGAKGEVSYAQVSSSSPYITVGSNGAINVLSTTQKGPHILKVKVTAAGNAKYKPASKTVKLKIKVS